MIIHFLPSGKFSEFQNDKNFISVKGSGPSIFYFKTKMCLFRSFAMPQCSISNLLQVTSCFVFSLKSERFSHIWACFTLCSSKNGVGNPGRNNGEKKRNRRFKWPVLNSFSFCVRLNVSPFILQHMDPVNGPLCQHSIKWKHVYVDETFGHRSRFFYVNNIMIVTKLCTTKSNGKGSS